MTAYEIKCPECGANLDFEEGRKQIFCQYCGTKIIISDDIERKEITHRYVNESDIVKSNNDLELAKLRHDEQLRNDKIRFRIIIWCSIAFILLMAYAHFSGM